MSGTSAEFLTEYARHRLKEGRALTGDALRSLPYLRSGPLAREWQVRARSFDAFVHSVLTPMECGTPLDILDLGAGNGWFSYRMARKGHRATAVDVRGDMVDGLGAAAELAAQEPFACLIASFEELPFGPRTFDVALFNASLHYARDLGRALNEAVRVVRPRGVVVIVDSPFYRCEADGAAMVAEKRAQGRARFGASADTLLSQDFAEFLTPGRLAAANPHLNWRRRRVFYPLWYEVRPITAFLSNARRPSRFDLWTAHAP